MKRNKNWHQDNFFNYTLLLLKSQHKDSLKHEAAQTLSKQPQRKCKEPTSDLTEEETHAGSNVTKKVLIVKKITAPAYPPKIKLKLTNQAAKSHPQY